MLELMNLGSQLREINKKRGGYTFVKGNEEEVVTTKIGEEKRMKSSTRVEGWLCMHRKQATQMCRDTFIFGTTQPKSD